jgi:glutamate dehydrogenase/leucine dehydrogenase
MHDPGRDPIRVTILGAGQVGKHAVEAATKHGSL